MAHVGNREEEARSAMERARALDPLQAMHHALSAQVAFLGRDFHAALGFAKQSAVVLSDFWIARLQMAQAHEQLGENEAALDVLSRGGGVGGENSKVIALRGYLLAKMGRMSEAREQIMALEAISRQRFVPPYAVGQIYAGLGETDHAIAWLNRAADEHDVHLAMLATDPKWDQLRKDAKFGDVLRRCGLPYPDA